VIRVARRGDQRQNITLVLPTDAIVAGKHMAVDDNTTLSDLVARLLLDEASRRDQRHAALARVRERLAHGYDLGTKGRISVRRDELHDR
jgi:hypothetical protein